ncbi:hypothetical protein QZH36_19885 [Erwinia sp. BC051422]|jgi:hypothetical protein|uniref:hypothetical protein n=1 Tax=Erwinia wuhanensis TaxID=3045167 RepID=UPI0026532BB4|nr:hypothetical protein [Erwinia sp. BC051422]MDN8543672.1 hypothetical protein [Erwinia sp. BC051422]
MHKSSPRPTAIIFQPATRLAIQLLAILNATQRFFLLQKYAKVEPKKLFSVIIFLRAQQFFEPAHPGVSAISQ